MDTNEWHVAGITTAMHYRSKVAGGLSCLSIEASTEDRGSTCTTVYLHPAARLYGPIALLLLPPPLALEEDAAGGEVDETGSVPEEVSMLLSDRPRPC